MRTALLCALVASAILSAPARAETSVEREACTPDVWRLCASAVPDVGAIKTCLRRERARLNPACRTAMDGGGPARTLAAERR